MSAKPNSGSSPINCDVLVVGAGFGGIYAIYKFRQLGLNVHCFEAGTDFGGVWYWNRYPGARVDSEFPFYQLSIPEVWKDWDFSVRYPDHAELRRHFAHIDKVLGIKRDVTFNAKVNSCAWDAEATRWTVKTEQGHTAICKYLFLASGLLHRRHYPEFPGLTTYEGALHHSAFYPEDLDVTGKKVAVIGAGATSVQIVQEVAKQAEHLTMFMRRPSYCLPMRQRQIGHDEQTQLKAFYGALFKEGRDSAAGFPSARIQKSFWDATPEEREAHWEAQWQRGAFSLLLTNYIEVILDLEANKLTYDFWRRKVHSRMHDKQKAELMAPKEMPYPFGTKRTPLEGDYYEMLDRPNVTIVQMKDNPLKTFNKRGMLMSDGTQHDFDIVILATGFDSFSGSVTQMGLKSKDGTDIKDVWNNGISSYLGLTVTGFPNAFMVYSPHAPTAFSNGPTILECQVDWVVETIKRMEEQNIKSIEPVPEAEKAWVDMIEAMGQKTLYPLTNSWWTGSNTNLPGKKPQMLTYAAGINTYEKACLDALEGWKGFMVGYEKEGESKKVAGEMGNGIVVDREEQVEKTAEVIVRT